MLRPVEIIGLRKQDISWNNEFNCYTALIPAKLTKKRIARTIKFSRECNNYISQCMKNSSNDLEQVFCKNPNLRSAVSNEGFVFSEYRKKVGFTQRFETIGRHKITLYSFRGYFFTKVLDRLKDDTAHAMTGHGAYLQTYQRRTLSEKIKLWNEIEPDILIFDLERENIEIQNLKA